MKKALLLILILASLGASAQKKVNTYSSLSMEMIFSWAIIDNQGNSDGNVMRWAPWFNPQYMINADFNEHVGLYSGFAFRNVGYIYNDPNDIQGAKYKFRTYNFGIPVGLKVGKMDNFLFFAGYEIEFPYVYKEKRFVNEDKEYKKTYWFSDRVNPVQHSLMAGFQFPFGATLKFKYYLTNFHNKNYEYTNTDGGKIKPYNYDANVFYFSLSMNMFRNWKDYDDTFKK